MRIFNELLVPILCVILPLNAASPPAPMFEWDNFTTKQGLPNDHVYCVLVDGPRVWIGTEGGLGVLEAGKWQRFTVSNGLAHRVVLSLARDDRSGDIWIGTMGGLSRYSGGRIDTYNQLNSGLPNDVVYGVSVVDGDVWVATAAGGAHFDPRTQQWAIFNNLNTPMEEIWTYSVDAHHSKVYYAVWGGGVLEFDVGTRTWKEYRDPDGETDLVVFKNQGLIHDITTSVSWQEREGVLWVASYFGASRYDGRVWENFLTKDSGLPSNFINQIKSVDSNHVWFCTDKGLSYYDGVIWAVYRPSLKSGEPEMWVRDAEGKVTQVAVTTAPSHNYILAVDFQGNDLWVATAHGLSHGKRLQQ